MYLTGKKKRLYIIFTISFNVTTQLLLFSYFKLFIAKISDNMRLHSQVISKLPFHSSSEGRRGGSNHLQAWFVNAECVSIPSRKGSSSSTHVPFGTADNLSDS